MCESCIEKFEVFTEQFNEVFTDYVSACQGGQVRDTPAERVNDLAESFEEHLETRGGRAVFAWHYAVALERLAALEISGVPT